MRMRRFSAKSFEDASRILRYLNYLLALRMLEWPRGKVRPYLSTFYQVFLTVFFVSTGIGNEWTRVLRIRVKKFETALYQSTFIFTIVSLNALSILGLRNSKLFLEYKKVMAKTEKQMQRLGGSIDNSDVFRRCLIYISLWFLFMFASLPYYVKWFTAQGNMANAITLCLSYCYCETIGTIIILDFVTSIHWHRLAYEQTNMLLRKGFRTPQSRHTIPVVEFEKGGNISSVNEILNRQSDGGNGQPFGRLESHRPINVLPKITDETLWIWRIRQMHLELCRGVKSVLNIYGMQMCIEMGLTLMLWTTKLYYLYVEYTRWDGTAEDYSHMTILSIIDCITLGVKLYVTSASCEYTLREIKMTNEILHCLPNGSKDPGFKDEAHQFALQIMQNEQGVVVHSFSSLSFNFIRMFLSSITTYLVIMIQMGNSMESDDHKLHA